MATEKQFAANRLNAQKSTGPRTPEGRAAVRLNGVTHGLTAETIVLKGESEVDFTNLLNSLEVEHDPATPTEEALVVQLAMATWRLRRLYHAEAGFYSFKLKQTADNRTELKLNDAERMGYIAYLSTDELGMFNRQEARLERSFYRALHELQRLHNPSVSAGAEPSEMPVAQPLSDAPAIPSREINLASVLQQTPESAPPYSPSVGAGAEPPEMPAAPMPPASGRPIL